LTFKQANIQSIKHDVRNVCLFDRLLFAGRGEVVVA